MWNILLFYTILRKLKIYLILEMLQYFYREKQGSV